MNIIQQLKKAGLKGRGGAGFPTWQKWDMVKNAAGSSKYVVCNLSEGEPGVMKDKFILENHLKLLVEGIELAMKTVRAQRAFIAIKDQYCDKYFGQIINHIGGQPIEIFRKTGGYISGEETALLEAIEGGRVEPRDKPPYPVTDGLWRSPTLVNNAETFYNAAQIFHKKYKNERLVSITGDCQNSGVFSVNENITIEQVLQDTENVSMKDFFVQVGGGMSGNILNQNQLNTTLVGMGAIVVYDRKKTEVGDLALKWAKFFRDESCGKCVPCREGTYRICEILESKDPDWNLLFDIFDTLKSSSFCPMGSFVPVPFEGLIKNVLQK